MWCGRRVTVMVRSILVSLAAAALMSVPLVSQQSPYSVVIKGGRVMDPETGLDAIRNVGLYGGTIALISSEQLEGAHTIDARGLVVAPGFIDLHSHGQDDENYRFKAMDGVTMALELEIGVADVKNFLQQRKGKSRVHYGTTASHPFMRVQVLGGNLVPGALVPQAGPSTQNPASAKQLERLGELVLQGIEEGALGIGMGITYTPGATRLEVIEMFRLAALKRVPVYVHVRSKGQKEPGSIVESIQELIAAAAVSGASLHIVHMNSSALQQAPECLKLVEGARARGLDVTTEAYPYIAGMTAINSASFNPGWRERSGVDYQDVQLVETGERLTRESFEVLHAMTDPKLVLIYQNTDEMVEYCITHPLVAIASDGILNRGKGHPRGAGTYARILARYVRDERRLSLMDALRKMSLMPAQRLEKASAAARKKGRLQVGSDADIVVFDPETVQDMATYEAPDRYSRGIEHVLVAGTPVVRNGALVDGALPGRPFVSDRGR